MSGITVRCIRDNGDKDGGTIASQLCTSKALATVRGKRHLDDPEQGNYYSTVKRKYQIPHKVMLMPEEFVLIDSARVDGGLFKCLSYELMITPNSVLASGEFIRYGT